MFIRRQNRLGVGNFQDATSYSYHSTWLGFHAWQLSAGRTGNYLYDRQLEVDAKAILSKPKLNQQLNSTEFEVRLHSYM